MGGERILVLTPSRGRPGRLAEMLDATLGTSGPGTHIAIGYDEDDPERTGYESLSREARGRWPGRTFWYCGPRRSVTRWTNWLAGHPRAARYPYLASLGDDHLPRTQGWDEQLTAAIEAAGGTGIAYGDDGHQHQNLPTAPVISAGIVAVLGWVMLPGLMSQFPDNAWRDLGDLAGCLYYVPGVVIEHCHPDAGKASRDRTYSDGHAHWAEDQAVYLDWARGQRDNDVAAIRDAIRQRA